MEETPTKKKRAYKKRATKKKVAKKTFSKKKVAQKKTDEKTGKGKPDKRKIYVHEVMHHATQGQPQLFKFLDESGATASEAFMIGFALANMQNSINSMFPVFNGFDIPPFPVE